ncbi:MAG: integrin alpha, partial [Planctomycetota bacterium]
MATHARRRPFPLALLAISGSALLAASGAPAQLTEPFPDIFEMPDLLAAGGDLGFRINGYLEEHRLGYALASAGDINNDGFDDVLVGMYDAPAGIANVYVVFGSADGPPAANISITELDGTNGFAIPGDLLWSYEHTNLAGVGDINNDGIDDIAIGEPLGNGFFPNAGRTIVIYGDADIGASGTFDIDTIDGTNGFTVRGYISGARFGYSVAPAGDVNGDGAVDLVIGAPRAFGAFPGAGQAYVIFGGSNVAPSGDINLFLLNPSQGFAIDGKELRAASGTTVCSAGDINADGFDDVLIGAVGAGEQDGVYDMGAAYVVFGGPAVGASGAISLADLDGTNG